MKQLSIISKLAPIKDFVVKHAILIFILSVVLLLVMMTFNIAHYANLDPTPSQKTDREGTLKVVKIDEKSITKIRQLQDRNISIESLFDNGRANPFE